MGKNRILKMEFIDNELNNKTKFVEELYYSKPDEDQVISNFYKTFGKTSYYVPIDKPLEKFASGSQMVYKIDTLMDQLLYIYYRITVPALSVKDECKDFVKISWSHNLLHNIFNRMTLRLNTKVYQTIDKYILDIHLAHNIHNDQKPLYKEQIGSIPMLEEWNTLLPSYILGFEPCFFFSSDISQSIPLNVFDDAIRDASFLSEPVLQIYKLLRISVKNENGEWRELEDIELSQLKRFVDGVNEDALLPIPEVIGRYVKMNKDEKEWRKECEESQIYYIDNYIDASPANTSKINTTSETLISSTSPCKKIYWLAENIKSSKQNLHSNYTTNSTDIQKGWNPCYSCKLKYGQNIRFSITYDQSSRHFPIKHCVGYSSEKGYNVFTFSYDKETFEADIGATFNDTNKTQLMIKLEDTNPYRIPVQRSSVTPVTKEELQNVLSNKQKEQNELDNDEYNVRVYLLSYRKVRFERNEFGKIILSIEDS